MTMQTGGPLDDGGITPGSDPFALFGDWMKEAEASEPNDPNAMALATADADGAPNVRMVLLKGVDTSGFVFFSNSQSIKGGELAANPRAAINFHWKTLRRAVRVKGAIDGRPLGVRETHRRICREIRPGHRAASAALDRLAHHARAHRVLARPPVPPA